MLSHYRDRTRKYLYFLAKKQDGQDLTEYALLVAFVAILVVLAIVFFGDQVSSFFTSIGSTVANFL